MGKRAEWSDAGGAALRWGEALFCAMERVDVEELESAVWSDDVRKDSNVFVLLLSLGRSGG